MQAALLRRLEPVFYGLGAALFYYLLVSEAPWFSDFDAYFHTGVAQLFLQQGWVARLPWMAHSIHADGYVHFHLLFQWYLAAFVLVAPDPIAGVQAATATAGGFSVAMLVVLLRGLRVDARLRWFWVLFFVLSSPVFTGRFTFGRGSTLFVGILYLYVHLLFRGRAGWALALAFMSVWTYPAFPLLVVVSGLVLATRSRAILAGGARLRLAVMAPLAGLCGIAAALIVHPSFPRQFYGYYLELVVHSQRPAGLEAIAEWQVMARALLSVALAIPLGLMLLTLLTAERRRLGDRRAWVFLGASLFVLASMLSSLKPFEYLVPFLAPGLALLWRDSIHFARAAGSLQRVRMLQLGLGGVAALAMILWGLPELTRRNALQYRLTNPVLQRDAALWLKTHTRPGELALIPWSAFPVFFYYNRRTTYPFGMNPVYAYGHNRKTYLLLRRLYSGVPHPDLVGAVPTLGARYVVLYQRQNAATIALLRKNGTCRAAYNNRRFSVLDCSAPTDKPGRR